MGSVFIEEEPVVVLGATSVVSDGTVFWSNCVGVVKKASREKHPLNITEKRSG